MSAEDRGIHNASCEICTPCVFPNQVNLHRGGVNGSHDIQCLRNRGSCVIKREYLYKPRAFDTILIYLYMCVILGSVNISE